MKRVCLNFFLSSNLLHFLFYHRCRTRLSEFSKESVSESFSHGQQEKPTTPLGQRYRACPYIGGEAMHYFYNPVFNTSLYVVYKC